MAPIPFNEVLPTTRTPFAFIELDSSRAATGVQAQPYRAIVMGLRLIATATISANVLMRVRNADEAAKYWGRGSQIHQSFETWFANNDSTEVYGMALANPVGGATATGSLVLAGTATEAGAINLYIGGRRQSVAVAIGATHTSLITTLAALVALDTSGPVTGAGVTDTLTLTSRHAGALGNDIDLRLNYLDGETVPAGITATVNVMSGGSGDTVVSTAFTQLGDNWFNVFVIPVTDATNLTAIEAEMISRASASRHIGGVVITAKLGDLSTLSTLGNSRNNPRVSILGTNSSPTVFWRIAAAEAAQIAKAAQIDPARPWQTLPMFGVLAPAQKDRFTQADRNSLLYSGISTFTVAADGTCQIERTISTYKTNPAGGSDPAWLDLNTALTLDFIRWDFANFVTGRYARHKVADDGTNFGSGQAIVTPSLMKAELFGRFRQWEELGLVEDFDQFKRDTIVERNRQDASRIDILMPPNLVNGLRVLGVKIAYIL